MKKIVLLIFAIGVWWLTSCFVNPLFIPSPMSVFKSFLEMLANGILLKGIAYSFLRITIATFISACVAIPIGLLIFNFKSVDSYISPITAKMRYLPITAFYPLLIMWFGIDEKMKIIFLFIATFVYMLPSVVLALKDVDQELIDTGITIGMSKMQLNRYVILPASLPSICQTFIMMYGIGWTYIAIVETINAKYGLGFIISVSSSRGRTDLVFMSIIAIVLISSLFDTFANKIVKKIFKWRFVNDTTK